MKQLLLIAALGWLCSCNTLHVAQNRTSANTTSIGVEWNYGQVSNEALLKSIDSVLNVEMEKFNSQKHSFTVHKKLPRTKEKDYLTIDFEKAKVVGSGGKVAGYVITTLGIAAPIALAVAKSPLILGFYYWPMHNIHSKVTLSPNLSDERKNNKYVAVMTGALFASDEKQVPKMLRKYAESFHKLLTDIETQLSRQN